MSNTPLTDAACGWPIGQHGRISSSDLIMGADGPFVHSSIARELERELNERELSEQLLIDGKGGEREAALLGKLERLECENAALRADKERLDWLFNSLGYDFALWNVNPAKHAIEGCTAADAWRAAIDAARKEAQP